MSFAGKTLTFIQGNTHEGMKWTILDEERGFPIDITGATINVLVQSVDGALTIINRVADIIDPTLGTCKLVPISTEMGTAGNFKVQLQIIFSDATEVFIQDMFINIISVLS